MRLTPRRASLLAAVGLLALVPGSARALQDAGMRALPPSSRALAPELLPFAILGLVFSGDEAAFAAITNYGLVLTRDGGKTWSLLCSRLWGVPSPLEPGATGWPIVDAAFAEKGALVVGMSGAWARSEGNVCGWQGVPGLAAARQLLAHPFVPSELFAVRSVGPAEPAPGAAPPRQEILRSTDDGKTFSTFSTIDAGWGRLYGGDAPHGAPTLHYFEQGFGAAPSLHTAIAGGSTFAKRPVAFGQPGDQVTLLAVRASTRIFEVREPETARPTEIWQEPLLAGSPGKLLTLLPSEVATGAATDGRRVWIATFRPGTGERRLLLAPGDGAPIVPVSTDFPWHSLTFQHGKLYATGAPQGQLGIWASEDDGRSWKTLFRPADLTAPACFGSLCAQALAYITARPAPDAGAPTVTLPKFDGGSADVAAADGPLTRPGPGAEAGVADGPLQAADAGGADAGAAAADAGGADAGANRAAGGGGCGCRLGAARPSAAGGGLFLAVVGLALGRRRRSR